MERQLNLFEEEVKKEFKVWQNFPDTRKNKIETGFVNLLIRFLCQSIEDEETAENEN
jgi:hypothetical protein